MDVEGGGVLGAAGTDKGLRISAVIAIAEGTGLMRYSFCGVFSNNLASAACTIWPSSLTAAAVAVAVVVAATTVAVVLTGDSSANDREFSGPRLLLLTDCGGGSSKMLSKEICELPVSLFPAY